MFNVDLCQDVIYVRPIVATFPAIDNTDGSSHNYITYRPGLPQYGMITLGILEHKDTFPAIKAWVKDCYDGKPCTKDITVTVYNQAKEDVRTFHLRSCFPIALRGLTVAAAQENGASMTWELDIRANVIDMA
jgi:phage tail-like protein